MCNNGACVQCTASSQCAPKVCQGNLCVCPAGTCGANCDTCSGGQTCQSGACACPSGQLTCNGTCSSAVVSCGGSPPRCATWNFETGLQGWSVVGVGTLTTKAAPQHSGNALALSFNNPQTQPQVQVTLCTGAGADIRGRSVRASIYIDQVNGPGGDPLRSAGLSIDGLGTASVGERDFLTQTWVTRTFDPSSVVTASNCMTMTFGFSVASSPAGTIYVDDIEVM
jgi:hypothetical protein